MDLNELRGSITALEAMTYVNAGWAGPSPRRVTDRIAAIVREESDVGPAGPEGLALARRTADEARAAAATMLSVSTEELVLTHGTTEGINIVLGGVDWQPGDELVTTNMEHPGLTSPATVLSERRGVTVRRMSLAPDASADEVLSTLANTLGPKTKLVALSHIIYTCGLRLPAEEIVETAHAAGALVLFDGAQTGGHIALDLPAIGADFYTISGQKWLMGPAATGTLFIKRERQGELQPLFTRSGLDSRTGLAAHTLTSQNAALNAGFAEAVALHLELGSNAVESHVTGLAGELRTSLAEIPGVQLNGPPNGPTASGITAISVDGVEPQTAVETLWDRHRIAPRAVPFPPGVRFSTAAFNSEQDVERVVAAVAELGG